MQSIWEACPGSGEGRKTPPGLLCPVPSLAGLLSRGLQRVTAQENLLPLAPVLFLLPALEGERQCRITHQPPAIHAGFPLSLSWDFKKKTPQPMVLLGFGFASLLGISHVLFFLEVTEAACDLH